MDYSERMIYFFTEESVLHFVFIFVFLWNRLRQFLKIMKNKKNFKKPATPRQPLWFQLEVARHNAHYEQFNTAYKATFGFAYLVLMMLFVASLFFSEIFGVLAVIASAFFSYLSQKNFHCENKKRGTLFQCVAIAFGCLSFICLGFYQFII